MSPGRSAAAPDGRTCDFCDEDALHFVRVHGVYREPGAYHGRAWVAQVCRRCAARHVDAPDRCTPAERARFDFVLGVFRTAMPLQTGASRR